MNENPTDFVDLLPFRAYIEKVMEARRKFTDRTPPKGGWLGHEDHERMTSAGEVLGAYLMRGAELPKPITGPDRGWDFEVCGTTFDVKTTEFLGDHPHLLVPIEKKLRADFYILIQIDYQEQRGDVPGWARRGRLGGWATQAELMNAPESPGYGTRPMKCRVLKRLRPPWGHE